MDCTSLFIEQFITFGCQTAWTKGVAEWHLGLTVGASRLAIIVVARNVVGKDTAVVVPMQLVVVAFVVPRVVVVDVPVVGVLGEVPLPQIVYQIKTPRCGLSRYLHTSAEPHCCLHARCLSVRQQCGCSAELRSTPRAVRHLLSTVRPPSSHLPAWCPLATGSEQCLRTAT